MTYDATDPVVAVTVWRGPRSALAALLNIPPSHLAALLKRRGVKRGGAVEISLNSPVAMKTLRHSLRIANEEP